MTTPEGKVKNHLRRRIKQLGGEVRFVRWIGRHSAPDTLVLLDDIPPTLVETKAKDGELSGGQKREFARLRRYGFRVLVLPTTEAIDHEFPEERESADQSLD